MNWEQLQRRRTRGIAALELAKTRDEWPASWQLGARNFSRDSRWGCAETPFGRIWLAAEAEEISRVAFAETCPWTEPFSRKDDVWAEELAQEIFHDETKARERLFVRGTSFELRVWELLCAIPTGAVVTYGDLAKALGNPRASRAVGQAVGRNEHAWLIPCHRVIAASGKIGGFRWGSACKSRFLAAEELEG